MGFVLEETEKAVKAALKEGLLTHADAAGVAALQTLAQQIDNMAETGVISDNTSLPTLLKYLESMAMTPAGRVKIQGAIARANAAAKTGGMTEEPADDQAAGTIHKISEWRKHFGS